jgi:acyl carrier protein
VTNLQDVKEMVVGYVKRTLPELKYEDINTKSSMKDLGATSIDILEVVSASMKKLGIQVPREKLNQLACLDDLIELLHMIKNEEECIEN